MRPRNGVIALLIASAGIVPLAGPAQAQDLDCRDFAFQEDAQAFFNSDPTDPSRLDEDQGADDGIACEVLPRRGTSTSPAVGPTVTPTSASMSTPTSAPTPSTVAPTRGVRGGLGGSSAAGPSPQDTAIGLLLVTGSLAVGYVVRRRRTG